MTDGTPTSRGAHDRLLVLRVAAIGLGVAIVHPGMWQSHPTTRPVPSKPAAVVRAEGSVTEPDDRLAAGTPRGNGIAIMPTTSTAIIDHASFADACTSRNNPDRDLRFVLADMAMQQRRIAGERPTEPSLAPPKQYVPLTDYVLSDQPSLALAEALAARADKSPLAVRRPIGPCLLNKAARAAQRTTTRLVGRSPPVPKTP